MAVKSIEIGNGKTIPIMVMEVDGVHRITVDGVEWVKTRDRVHAAVLFNMMADHLTGYMRYSGG